MNYNVVDIIAIGLWRIVLDDGRIIAELRLDGLAFGWIIMWIFLGIVLWMDYNEVEIIEIGLWRIIM